MAVKIESKNIVPVCPFCEKKVKKLIEVKRGWFSVNRVFCCPYCHKIVELSAGESELLLGYLTKWVGSPRFTVRYHWTPGTIAMWDNRCTQHSVLNDFEGERVIQRVTVMGDKPLGASPRWEPYRRTAGKSDTIRHDGLLSKYLRGEGLQP